MLNWLRVVWLDLTWTYPMGMSRQQASEWFQALVDDTHRQTLEHQRRFIREVGALLEEKPDGG